MDDTNHWQSQGIFWPDGDESNQVSGTITYSPGLGCELRLAGVFDRYIEDLFNQPQERFPLVHGITNSFARVAVFDGLVRNRHVSFSGGVHETIISSPMVMTGNSGHDLASAYLITLRACLAGLQDWLEISGFQIRFNADCSNVGIDFTLPSRILFEDADDVRIRFAFGFSGPEMRRPQTEAVIKQSTYLDILPRTPRSLASLREALKQTSDLISLGLGAALKVTHLSAELAIPTSGPYTVWADIWLKGFVQDAEPRDSTDMIFSFQAVRQRFGKMLASWSQQIAVIEPTYQLYFGTLRSTGMYAEHRLVNFFQALESFHQRGIAVDEEAKRDLMAKRDRIIALVSDEEDLEWLKKKLAFAHQPTASERIQDLVKRFNAEWIFGVNDWQAKVQRIAKVRNYLTHFTKQPPKEDLELLSLFNFGSELQVLCEAVLLVQLGFSAVEAQNLLQSNRRLQRLTFTRE